MAEFSYLYTRKLIQILLMTKKMILLNASPRKNKNTAHVQSVCDNQWPKDLQAAYELASD